MADNSLKMTAFRGLLITALFASCSQGPSSIAPSGFAPADRAVVMGWLDRFVPDSARRYEIRPWRYRNEQGAAAGRAAVVVAPPDSLRFDYQGPFRKSGRAAIVGDSALWVVPEEDFRSLVTFAPLFWGALGLPQEPPGEAPLFSTSREDLKAWRYIVNGDTLNFVLRGVPATRFLGEIRRRGRTIGSVDAQLDPATGLVTQARIDLPVDVSRFEFTITNVENLATIDPSIWQNR